MTLCQCYIVMLQMTVIQHSSGKHSSWVTLAQQTNCTEYRCEWTETADSIIIWAAVLMCLVTYAIILLCSICLKSFILPVHMVCHFVCGFDTMYTPACVCMCVTHVFAGILYLKRINAASWMFITFLLWPFVQLLRQNVKFLCTVV